MVRCKVLATAALLLLVAGACGNARVGGGSSGAGAHNVPTFGWNINTEWTGPPSLFGEKGSFLDLTSASPVPLPYLAKRLGVTKVGTLAYNVAQSTECADQQAISLRKYGFDMIFR